MAFDKLRPSENNYMGTINNNKATTMKVSKCK